ncbi:plasmolipin [Nelusetta ayraudi]|uniref:plasmolipin n=1 Tax=Nelusetta ayraudi TaxID=303726 RepID=UPI003F714A35
MADFPSNVSTETSSPAYQNQAQGGNSLRGLATSASTVVDMFFFKSIPAILMMVEVFVGMLHWALIASGPHALLPAYGWVLFVAITLWLLTIILFFLILFSVLQKMPSVPWSMVVMVYHGVATVLYFTAFVANAASVDHFVFFRWYYNNLAAASFFGALTTLVYSASAFFSYLEWRGDGGNAATSTVPT